MSTPFPAGLNALARAVAGTAPGNRNNVLAWAVATAVEEDYATAEIRDALALAARDAGLEGAEIRTTITSGIRRAERRGKRGTKVRMGSAGELFQHWIADPRNQAELEALRGDIATELELGRVELMVPIGQYRAGVPDDPRWIAAPLVYAGGVTLLSGPPKKGKSTLATQLMRSRETGGRFLGNEVWRGPCLLVTEESGIAVTHKTSGLNELHILDRRTALRAELDWPDTLREVQRWADRSRLSAQSRDVAALVVIDTLAIWAQIEDENNASQVTAALAPVMQLAANTGAGVVLVHHSREGGGRDGEAIRGSGAMLATVDIAGELSIVADGSDDRWLDVQGRVIFPERIRLTFDRETTTYAVQDRREAKRAEMAELVAGLPVDGEGWDRATLRSYWGVRETRRREAALAAVGLLRTAFKDGKGPGTGWRFWRGESRQSGLTTAWEGRR